MLFVSELQEESDIGDSRLLRFLASLRVFTRQMNCYY